MQGWPSQRWSRLFLLATASAVNCRTKETYMIPDMSRRNPSFGFRSIRIQRGGPDSVRPLLLSRAGSRAGRATADTGSATSGWFAPKDVRFFREGERFMRRRRKQQPTRFQRERERWLLSSTASRQLLDGVKEVPFLGSLMQKVRTAVLSASRFKICNVLFGSGVLLFQGLRDFVWPQMFQLVGWTPHQAQRNNMQRSPNNNKLQQKASPFRMRPRRFNTVKVNELLQIASQPSVSLREW